ncbi:MAG: PEP-CTERM sorting domain-containing protein [Deltaproteobacteria bacterium]|jgi:hypothetical protein|nr:PEP-CTERM sorting domain-containing protein [Deltaproteobacteria bacterium]
MKKLRVLLYTVLLCFVMVTVAYATLVVRGTDSVGNQLIYDTDLDVTWYDYAKSFSNWYTQKVWADTLTINFEGNIYNDWRLPSTVDGVEFSHYKGPETDGSYTYTSGYNLYNSEMGHLFYIGLGNQGHLDTAGNYVGDGNWGLNNTDSFQNLINCTYWSGTEFTYSGSRTYAWLFDFTNGTQSTTRDLYSMCTIAACHGDVAAPVPEPCTMLLLGIGIAGLGLYRRKRGRRQS